MMIRMIPISAPLKSPLRSAAFSLYEHNARLGNTEPGDGALFRGRGFVQLTWERNYIRAGQEIGVDLITDPDRAMDPQIAAEVLVRGLASDSTPLPTKGAQP